jgi:hypothetical protein
MGTGDAKKTTLEALAGLMAIVVLSRQRVTKTISLK